MYSVEKAIRRHAEFNLEDTITEAAVCMDCMVDMQQYISEESREVLMQYYQRFNPIERAERLLSIEGYSLENWIQECVFTGKKLEDCNEFQLTAFFSGKQMMLHFAQLMVSDSAGKELAELLSKETRDHLDRFMGEHFGLPPELVNLPLLI